MHLDIKLYNQKILLACHVIFHLDLAIAQGAPTPTVDNYLDFKLYQTTYHLINELFQFIFVLLKQPPTSAMDICPKLNDI